MACGISQVQSNGLLENNLYVFLGEITKFFCSHLQNVKLILLLGVMILCFLLLERGNSYEKKRCSTIAMYILYSTLYLMKVVSASIFLKIG